MRVARRTVLKALGGMASAPLFARFIPAATFATEDAQNVRFAWQPISAPPIVRQSHDPADAMRSPTLLPMGSLISNAVAPWYLYLWTHDVAQFYLYVADSPAGPWGTPYATIGVPGSLPADYLQDHFSSGDIVWDPAGQRLIATPHGATLDTVPDTGEPYQDSFMIESSDGLSWDWLDGDNSPRLLAGRTPGSVDQFHTGYGRLLRDLDGHLALQDGEYWWLYRGARKKPENLGSIWTPCVASAGSIGGPWTKHGRAFVTGASSVAMPGFDVGSFIAANSRHAVYYAEAESNFFLNSVGNTFTYAGPGVPVALPNTQGDIALGAGNVVRDPVTQEQYLAAAFVRVRPNTMEPTGFSVWIFREVVP